DRGSGPGRGAVRGPLLPVGPLPVAGHRPAASLPRFRLLGVPVPAALPYPAPPEPPPPGANASRRPLVDLHRHLEGAVRVSTVLELARRERHLGPDSALPQLSSILRRAGQFRAIDLAGNEAGYAARLFAPAYDRAREAGLRLTAHAGE